MKKSIRFISIVIVIYFITNSCIYNKTDFLRPEGKLIVNNNGPFLIRAINFGNWMVQESYMMKTHGTFPQHKLKQLYADIVGEEKMKLFYEAWLNNFITEEDVIYIKELGFNTIRLPMHYNLFTPPIEEEPVKGQITWVDKGFELTDNLLEWCSKHEIYLILDLHAAPGGQGKDANINDYDPGKPALWESEENKAKTVALWQKLAQRYANEPWIGGYDIINETNWSFEDGKHPNGINDTSNSEIKKLFTRITQAIWEVDRNHIIFIEGNGWANNFSGLTPPWDKKIVYSFHHYWQRNRIESIQRFIDMRDQFNVPLWMGEAGENSNEWFAEAIWLLEKNNIGWAWWPYKKFDSRTSLIEVQSVEDYRKILDFQKNPVDSLKPDPDDAFNALMQLAENHKLQNCKLNKGYHDALFRQVYSDSTLAYAENKIPGRIFAVDYDLGRLDAAYSDTDFANYFISDGGDRVAYNLGGFYRNDGVDISRSSDLTGNGFCVSDIEDGEWLKYTLKIDEAGSYDFIFKVLPGHLEAEMQVQVADSNFSILTIPSQELETDWIQVQTKLNLQEGIHSLRLTFNTGDFKLGYFDVYKSL